MSEPCPLHYHGNMDPKDEFPAWYRLLHVQDTLLAQIQCMARTWAKIKMQNLQKFLIYESLVP